MKPALMFDLDGTLWDSSASVARAWNKALTKLGYAPMTTDDVAYYMGWPMDAIGDDLFKDVDDPARRMELLSLCTNEENSLLSIEGGELYPKLEETLLDLRHQGYFTAIVSNCQAGYIEAFLKAHHLRHCFDDWICWDDTQLAKSKNIRILMQRNGIEEAVYVGDIDKDGLAARNAGIGFIWAAYGFGKDVKEGIRLDAFELLPEVLKKNYED